MFQHRRVWVAALLVAWGAAFEVGVKAESELPAQFSMSRMKTKILLATHVTLTTGNFRLSGDTYTASYDTKITPWSFKNESGTVTLEASQSAYERMVRGESFVMKGHAKNTEGEIRQITVQSRPTDSISGRSKVRVSFGIIKLDFDGTYRLSAPPSNVPLVNTVASKAPGTPPADAPAKSAGAPPSTTLAKNTGATPVATSTPKAPSVVPPAVPSMAKATGAVPAAALLKNGSAPSPAPAPKIASAAPVPTVSKVGKTAAPAASPAPMPKAPSVTPSAPLEAKTTTAVPAAPVASVEKGGEVLGNDLPAENRRGGASIRKSPGKAATHSSRKGLFKSSSSVVHARHTWPRRSSRWLPTIGVTTGVF